MKRHPQLQPLSDDHHTALVLARHVRRAGAAGVPADLTDAWRDARARFARELEPHFRVEESTLFPSLDAAGERAAAAEARADHARLRELIAEAGTPENAVAFGETLHRHVRFEERELFPLAERVLGEAALEGVGRAAREARAARASALAGDDPDAAPQQDPPSPACRPGASVAQWRRTTSASSTRRSAASRCPRGRHNGERWRPYRTVASWYLGRVLDQPAPFASSSQSRASPSERKIRIRTAEPSR